MSVSSWSFLVHGPPSWLVLPESSLANLVLTTPGCGDSVDMVFPPVPVKAVMPRLRSYSWTSLVSLKVAATELKYGTSKLRYSSLPFSKRFPSCPVPDLSSGTPPVVGASPGPRLHDRDPVNERPTKRFRITGKSSADKRARGGIFQRLGDGKGLVPQGTGLLREEVGLPPNLFPRPGGDWCLSDAWNLQRWLKCCRSIHCTLVRTCTDARALN